MADTGLLETINKTVTRYEEEKEFCILDIKLSDGSIQSFLFFGTGWDFLKVEKLPSLDENDEFQRGRELLINISHVVTVGYTVVTKKSDSLTYRLIMERFQSQKPKKKRSSVKG